MFTIVLIVRIQFFSNDTPPIRRGMSMTDDEWIPERFVYNYINEFQTTIGSWNNYKTLWSSRSNSNIVYYIAQVGISRLFDLLLGASLTFLILETHRWKQSVLEDDREEKTVKVKADPLFQKVCFVKKVIFEIATAVPRLTSMFHIKNEAIDSFWSLAAYFPRDA